MSLCLHNEAWALIDSSRNYNKYCRNTSNAFIGVHWQMECFLAGKNPTKQNPNLGKLHLMLFLRKELWQEHSYSKDTSSFLITAAVSVCCSIQLDLRACSPVHLWRLVTLHNPSSGQHGFNNGRSHWTGPAHPNPLPADPCASNPSSPWWWEAAWNSSEGSTVLLMHCWTPWQC